ncbi:MAG: hypothetical protein ACT4NY_22780 [Pseudonocardiales bacterium]
MTWEVMALGPFLTSLEQRLDELPAERLRRLLVEHGTQLPPGERVVFLRMFDTADPTGHHDPELLDDAESFVTAVAQGAYWEACAFDPEYGDYRTFGDESWTTEMDDLLDRAGKAFLAGHVTSARSAYQILLEALIEDDAGSNLPGAGLPEELIGSDTGEAKARYLRSVWESEPTATRAIALVEAAEALAYLGGQPTLTALDTTRREPLPDLDRLLPELIAALGEIHPEDLGFGPQARILRAEASERHRGVDGLAELARTPGPCRAEAYQDWVDALARTGRWDDAEQAIREALAQLDPRGSVRAGLAERLALLAVVRDNSAALLDARRAAWRADPTLRRLLRLVEVATALDRRDEVLSEEAGYLAEGPPAKRPDLAALMAAVLLLNGRVEDTTALMATTDQAFWEHRTHPGPVIVPFLLIGGSAATDDHRWPSLLLCDLLKQVNDIDSPRGPDADLDAFRAALPAGSLPADSGKDLPLSLLLINTLSSLPAGSQRQVWLDQARTHIDTRVVAVVDGKHRPYYERVAELTAACAEAITLTSGARAGQAYLDDLHDRYPRHSLLRKELRSAAARSPLL